MLSVAMHYNSAGGIDEVLRETVVNVGRKGLEKYAISWCGSLAALQLYKKSVKLDPVLWIQGEFLMRLAFNVLIRCLN